MDTAEPDDVAAKRDDVGAAIREALRDVRDLGGAANVAHAILVGEDDHERLVVVDAAGDELLIALLKDMQRQRLAGDKHELEWKDWKVSGHMNEQ